MTDDTSQLRPVGLEFLETAAHRFEFDAPLAAPPASVFAAISADPSTWTWFPESRPVSTKAMTHPVSAPGDGCASAA